MRGTEEAERANLVSDSSHDHHGQSRSLRNADPRVPHSGGFDKAALDAGKENKPAGAAVAMAAAMGLDMLAKEQCRSLQQLGEFDVKTSSGIATPKEVRSLGGALFCDRRYGKVFVHHNGVQSYYAARGFC